MHSKSIEKILAELSGDGDIYYKPNPGNGGDSLIALGAFTVFRKLGLSVKIIEDDNFDCRGKTVIYAGGGNLVGIYPNARDYILNNAEKFKRFILLPHTVKSSDDVLSVCGKNFILFARESVSYKYLKENATAGAEICLDHDMAFHVDPREYLENEKISLIGAIAKKLIWKTTGNDARRKVPSPSRMVKNSVLEVKGMMDGRQVGNFFRSDAEAIKQNRSLPKNNIDLSSMYEYGTSNMELCEYAASRMLNYINKFEVINTDRLHVCIGAALLGKNVNFYPNSYYKCKAVFDYSIKDKFSNVTWCGD